MRWYFVIDEMGLWHWEREHQGITTAQGRRGFREKALCIADARAHGFGASPNDRGAPHECLDQLKQPADVLRGTG